MGFLRFLRVFSFIGFALMIGLVFWKDIPFFYIVGRALSFNGTYSYAALAVLVLFVAYPLFFLLTILVLKIKGWHIYWIYGKEELSLWGLFTQNEVRPFWNFLIDDFDRISSPHRFPYSVDFGYSRHKILAFLYRALRCIIILCIITGLFFLALELLSGM